MFRRDVDWDKIISFRGTQEISDAVKERARKDRVSANSVYIDCVEIGLAWKQARDETDQPERLEVIKTPGGKIRYEANVEWKKQFFETLEKFIPIWEPMTRK